MKIDATNGDSLWNFRTERGGFYFWHVDTGAGTVFAQTSNHLIAFEPYQAP